MDLVHGRASIIAEEDRISSLPDDIIHRILSFLDMKYAMQTSTLSKKWKHVWTSMPHLNIDSSMFYSLPQFARFVKHVLSHRNHRSEVFAVELKYTGQASQFAVKNLVNYAYSHNVRHLNTMWCTKKVIVFPQYLFSSHTLKHLTLATNGPYNSNESCIPRCCVPESAWDFLVLETLKLSNIQLSDATDRMLNLFSKCVNLKDLTLHGCNMLFLDIFNVCAPQLENLTLLVDKWVSRSLPLSTEGLDSLEKVNLSISLYSCQKERYTPKLLDLFQKLCSAKFLILNMDIIEALSSNPDQLALEPCQFNNLKCLKIDKRKDLIATNTMPTQVRNYFLESSPSATIIVDLPQVAQKRSREDVDKDTVANKVVKLEEEKHIQDEVILLLQNKRPCWKQ